MKRVLSDENLLPAFEIRTVQEEGWGSIQNGELLRRAVGRFDVFLTADRRMQYQQKLIAFGDRDRRDRHAAPSRSPDASRLTPAQ